MNRMDCKRLARALGVVVGAAAAAAAAAATVFAAAESSTRLEKVRPCDGLLQIEIRLAEPSGSSIIETFIEGALNPGRGGSPWEEREVCEPVEPDDDGDVSSEGCVAKRSDFLPLGRFLLFLAKRRWDQSPDFQANATTYVLPRLTTQ